MEIRMKLFAMLVAMSCAPVFAEEAVEAPPDDPVSLQALLEEAREHNPKIQAAKATWESARQQVIQDARLDDPKVSYTFFGEELHTRVGPQEQILGISQKLPLPSKLYYRGKAASQEAQAKKELYRATEQEVLTQVKQAYYELFWIRKAVEITDQDKALLEHLEQVAGAHFAAHAGRQQDVSKAQVEISRAIDRLLGLKRRAATVEARMHALLDRPTSASLGAFAEFELPALSYSQAELQELAAAHRQELRAAKHRKKRDRAEVSLAKWDFLPDVTTGFNYFDIGDGQTTQPNDGDNAWNVMFTLDLPIWEHGLWTNFKQAKANAASSSASYEEAVNQTEFEVADAYFQWETAKNLVDLYDSAVIPQAEQSLDAAESAYRAGRADFLNLLDSQRVWLTAQLTYWRAYMDTAKHLAALERATGVPLLTEARQE